MTIALVSSQSNISAKNKKEGQCLNAEKKHARKLSLLFEFGEIDSDSFLKYKLGTQ